MFAVKIVPENHCLPESINYNYNYKDVALLFHCTRIATTICSENDI